MQNNKGFTLIELLVVISIIALLMSVIISSVQSARQKAIWTKFDSEMIQFKKAIELYKTSNNDQYPPSSLNWRYSNAEVNLITAELFGFKSFSAPSISIPSGFNIYSGPTEDGGGFFTCNGQIFNDSGFFIYFNNPSSYKGKFPIGSLFYKIGDDTYDYSEYGCVEF